MPRFITNRFLEDLYTSYLRALKNNTYSEPVVSRVALAHGIRPRIFMDYLLRRGGPTSREEYLSNREKFESASNENADTPKENSALLTVLEDLSRLPMESKLNPVRNLTDLENFLIQNKDVFRMLADLSDIDADLKESRLSDMAEKWLESNLEYFIRKYGKTRGSSLAYFLASKLDNSWVEKKPKDLESEFLDAVTESNVGEVLEALADTDSFKYSQFFSDIKSRVAHKIPEGVDPDVWVTNQVHEGVLNVINGGKRRQFRNVNRAIAKRMAKMGKRYSPKKDKKDKKDK